MLKCGWRLNFGGAFFIYVCERKRGLQISNEPQIGPKKTNVKQLKLNNMKTTKNANRNNNANIVMNVNPQHNDKVIIKRLPYGDWTVAVCNLKGYTFELQRIYKKEYTDYTGRVGEPGRLVVIAQNEMNEIKILRCDDSFAYNIEETCDRLREQGYSKNQRVYELEVSYVDSISMDVYFAQFDYDFEGDILYNAFNGEGRMWVNFIQKGKFVCRI